ncbi:chemotaxis protein CheB [soil metagenome]
MPKQVKTVAEKKAPAAKTTAPTARRAWKTPPVVGIGTSAGGLDALQRFLKHVPENSSIAYVIIQHLDPTHTGMLPDLLQLATTMPVVQAGNRMRVHPDCVYVIPPNKDMSILHGVLYLLEPVAPRGLRLPIDFFLRSLAEDRRELAIGVILTGMGSDGTLGLRAIKEKAGMTLVQDPATAQFDMMPCSAIDAGVVDMIGPVETLPGKIVNFLGTFQPTLKKEPILAAEEQNGFEAIVLLIRERTGNDFSEYKRHSIFRRIERRMSLHQIKKVADYVRYLRQTPQELDLLFKELLIGVTNFFRDPALWDYLKQQAMPEMLAAHPDGTTLRAWVPGCSTGEEAYSLAIAFMEALDATQPRRNLSLQIFATDLDTDAIDKARAGTYPLNIAADVPSERLNRFFIEEVGRYRVCKEIREMVVFAPHNIAMDPLFTKLDILSCRNLLIYFDAKLQNKLMPLFHYALNPNGLLVLGSAESIGNHAQLFAVIESKLRVYRRLESRKAGAVDFPSKRAPATRKPPEEAIVARLEGSFQYYADQYLLQNLAPPAVLVNTSGDIVYVNGRTGRFLEPASGKANLNVHAMAREGMRYELAEALDTVHQRDGTVLLEGLRVDAGKGEAIHANVTVQAIDKPVELQGLVMIAFHEVAAPVAGKVRASRRPDPDAVEATRLAVNKVRAEMQATQEELTSANEELQSTSEELQSTNEELTTSKEEMQSMNEELQSVNAELQSKIEDLSLTNSDMKNLLNSTDIATIFLDNSLAIRRFTDSAVQIFNLIAGDIGRPLSDITNRLDYPGLQQDAAEVLRTLLFCEKQIAGADQRWFRVRIMPYRTLENFIDGVVITFSDISAFKTLEAELRSQQAAAVSPYHGKAGQT